MTGSHSGPQSGFLGNLNASQVYKLKEAYLALFQASDSGHLDTKIGLPAPSDDNAGSQGKSVFSPFKSSSNNNKPDPNESADVLKEFIEACGDVPKPEIFKAFANAVRGDHPDGLMLRFLRARKWNTGKALVQLGHTLHWRTSERHVDEIVERGEDYYINKNPDPGFLEQLTSGKVMLHGHDKQQRPILYVNVAKHDPKAQSTESMELFTIYLIETIRLTLTNEVSTAVVVFNMEGFGLGNMDYHMVKFLLGCFEQYYPECLGYLFIHKAPWVFSSIWAIIKGWIDPVVASKISFTKKPADLLKYIDSSQLPKYLGGKSPFEYKYIKPVENENAFLSNEDERNILVERHNTLYAKFEALTLEWIKSTSQAESDELYEKRNEFALKLSTEFWELDPYVRARTIADRNGTLGEFKTELQSGNVAQPTL